MRPAPFPPAEGAIDPRTLLVYNEAVARFAAAHGAARPEALCRLALLCFHPGGATADLGCGCGRDAAWLAAEGCPVTGYDASEGMLAAARARHPGLDLRPAALPALEVIPDASFDNVSCSAVLMHVRREDLITAVLSLARVLRPGQRPAGSVFQSARRRWGGEARRRRASAPSLLRPLPARRQGPPRVRRTFLR